MLLRKPLAHIAVNAVGTYIADMILPAFVVTGGIWGYIGIGFLVGILNLLVKPLVKVVSLPVIFLTLGLFLIIINALILFLTEYVLSFVHIGQITLAIDGVFTYIIAALIYSVFHFFVWKLFR